MKKRLVRKTFDMIEDIANRENKEVYWKKLLELSLKCLKTHGLVGRFFPTHNSYWLRKHSSGTEHPIMVK